LGIEAADASLPVMCASLPFWLAGFWRPHGMRAERFLPLLWEHATGDGVLLYRGPEAHRLPDGPIAVRTTRRHRRRARRRGAELREPSKEGS
ncbi:MAG: PrgI family protein, partial [Coriobacteriaceae bacterium]|nr:PrgI family protein [Coriobacteriaceae bacterium]